MVPKDNVAGEEASVLSLGSSLSRKQVSLWKRVEMDIFRDNPNYIPAIIIKKKEDEKEFFILYQGGEPVGRAAATLDRRWMRDKRENLGFIDDFVIRPDYAHLADMLIDQCLAVLKERGVEGVIARSQSFPALAAQEFQELSPFGMPCNPPWYVNLFEQRSFVKYKEWANFRFTLPSQPSEEAIARWEQCLTRLHTKCHPLNMRSRSQIKEYSDITYQVLVDHFGYTPMRLMDSHSFIKYLLFGIACRIGKFRIYVLHNDSGKMIGFVSYCPDYNIALRPLVKYLSKFNPFVAIPRFVISLHRSKRAEIGAIGLLEEARMKGYIRAVDYALGIIKEEGYEQLDSGPVLVENTAVVKMAESLHKRYEVSMERMRFYTLRYTF